MSGVTTTAEPASSVAAAARRRGASVGTVGPATRRLDLLTQIGLALHFPAYYGRNLDALDECLNDLSWLPEGEVVLVWDGEAALRGVDPTGHAAVLNVLTAAAAATADTPRPLTVVLASTSPR